MTDVAGEAWRAGRWQRGQADAWTAWRASESSLWHPRLEALIAAISRVARGYLLREETADAAVRQFPSILRCCDVLDFDTLAQTVSHMIWHLADRYGRVTQVLDLVFAEGHLPIRRRGVTVLEVGAGPAPALFAVRDYYDDLRNWAASTGLDIKVAPVTVLNSIDRGSAWSALLHTLSETLWKIDSPRSETTLPFAIGYDDLTDFSARGQHVNAIDRQARAIQDEFDRSDEYVSKQAARQFALDDGDYPPGAYDLIIMCNFLTNEKITQRFEAEIREIARSLSPGGLFIVLGGVGKLYPAIYKKLRDIVASSQLRPLAHFDVPLQFQVDEWQSRIVGAQIR